MNKLIYKLSLPFAHKIISEDVAIARAILNRIRPKPNSSSITTNKISIDNIDLQIIIPAYNVQEYLTECLDSILSQKTTYTYKIILIDDGSTDNTPRIVDKYSSNTNIIAIHQENCGLSGARNRGLSNIFARYITFVDSDDRLAPGAIQSLLDFAYNTNADIVEGNAYSFRNSIKVTMNAHSNQNGIKALGTIRGFAWGKVYRSKFFENIRFPEGYWFEDSINPYLLYQICKSASTINKVVYEYRNNTNGISYTAPSKPKCIDTYWITEQMLEDEQKLGILVDQDIYEQTLRQIILNYKRTSRMSREIKEAIFTLSVELLNKYFKEWNTSVSKLIDLERALRTNDFGLYSLYCCIAC
jgi:glycosyltransferase involved in cell wall biosynthesis